MPSKRSAPAESSRAASKRARNDEPEVHCSCGQPDHVDDLIGCDLCRRWFHLSCVSLSAVPDDDWHCDACAADTGRPNATARAVSVEDVWSLDEDEDDDVPVDDDDDDDFDDEDHVDDDEVGDLVEYDLRDGACEIRIVEPAIVGDTVDTGSISAWILAEIEPILAPSRPSDRTREYDTWLEFTLNALFDAARKDYAKDDSPFTPGLQYWLRRNFGSRGLLIEKGLAAFPDSVKEVLASRDSQGRQGRTQLSSLPSEKEIPFDATWGLYTILGDAQDEDVWYAYEGSATRNSAQIGLHARRGDHGKWIDGSYDKVIESREKDGRRCLKAYESFAREDVKVSFHALAKFQPVSGLARFHLKHLIILMETARMIHSRSVNSAAVLWMTPTDWSLVSNAHHPDMPSMSGQIGCNWELPIKQSINGLGGPTRQEVKIMRQVAAEFDIPNTPANRGKAYRRAQKLGFKKAHTPFYKYLYKLLPSLEKGAGKSRMTMTAVQRSRMADLVRDGHDNKSIFNQLAVPGLSFSTLRNRCKWLRKSARPSTPDAKPETDETDDEEWAAVGYEALRDATWVPAAALQLNNRMVDTPYQGPLVSEYGRPRTTALPPSGSFSAEIAKEDAAVDDLRRRLAASTAAKPKADGKRKHVKRASPRPDDHRPWIEIHRDDVLALLRQGLVASAILKRLAIPDVTQSKMDSLCNRLRKANPDVKGHYSAAKKWTDAEKTRIVAMLRQGLTAPKIHTQLADPAISVDQVMMLCTALRKETDDLERTPPSAPKIWSDSGKAQVVALLKQKYTCRQVFERLNLPGVSQSQVDLLCGLLRATDPGLSTPGT